jgi:hypothetical protein
MQIQQELVFWRNGQPPYRIVKETPEVGRGWKEDYVLLNVRVEQIVQSEGAGWASSFEGRVPSASADQSAGNGDLAEPLVGTGSG